MSMHAAYDALGYDSCCMAKRKCKELRQVEDSQKQSHSALLQQLQTEQDELAKMLEMTQAPAPVIDGCP